MTPGAKPTIVIHGHFYQPPRENPWTGQVERQASAAPDHDWNLRIARECYLPNVKLGNLQHLSFNFGPTLLSWADDALPELSAAVAEADRAAVKLTGHGSAMAQVFSHPIAPLLTERDRRTQVRWGIADFERRYGRKPKGMWLPECAVNTASLRTLAEEGIQFTILAASQALRFREGAEPWVDVGEMGIDTSQPARVELGGGTSIEVLFYNRPASQEISFGDTLVKSEYLVDSLKRSALAAGNGGLVLVATDGETFGHHKKGGEATLAAAIAVLTHDADVQLSTPEAVLAGAPPTRVVEIREESAWSCAHGLGRWTLDCGCRMTDTRQAWRAPLREAVDGLTARLHAIFEREGAEVFRDPWDARDRATGLPSAALSRQEYFLSSLRDPTHVQDRRRALRLLEMERQVLLAHTSCGWFFDDLAGIEPVQNLRCAARALELSHARGTLQEDFVKILERAVSNDPALGDGAAIYKSQVLDHAIDSFRAAAAAVFSWTSLDIAAVNPEALAKPAPARIVFGGFVVEPLSIQFDRVKLRTLATGVVSVADIYEAPADLHSFASLDMGDGERFVYFGPAVDAECECAEARAVFVKGSLPDLLRILTAQFPDRLVHDRYS